MAIINGFGICSECGKNDLFKQWMLKMRDNKNIVIIICKNCTRPLNIIQVDELNIAKTLFMEEYIV